MRGSLGHHHIVLVPRGPDPVPSRSTVTVPNRIVMAPMTRRFSPGDVPDEDVVAYYVRRAAAGVGLLVTEGAYVGHESAGDPPYPEAPAVGPSGPRNDGTESTGRAMTQQDLDGTAAFTEAAERIGFAGVEPHGAHGCLIDQFLWKFTNRRTDAYGGDPVAHAKFAAEIVAAARDAVPPSFPVVFRCSQWKLEAYDARIAGAPRSWRRSSPHSRRRAGTPSTTPRAATGSPSSRARTSISRAGRGSSPADRGHGTLPRAWLKPQASGKPL